MTESEFRQHVRAEIKKSHRFITRWAEENGWSFDYVSDILNGKKPIPDWMLAQYGFERSIQKIRKRPAL